MHREWGSRTKQMGLCCWVWEGAGCIQKGTWYAALIWKRYVPKDKRCCLTGWELEKHDTYFRGIWGRLGKCLPHRLLQGSCGKTERQVGKLESSHQTKKQRLRGWESWLWPQPDPIHSISREPNSISRLTQFQWAQLQVKAKAKGDWLILPRFLWILEQLLTMAAKEATLSFYWLVCTVSSAQVPVCNNNTLISRLSKAFLCSCLSSYTERTRYQLVDWQKLLEEESRHRSLDRTELGRPGDDIFVQLDKGGMSGRRWIEAETSTMLSRKLWVTINTEEVLGCHQKHKESYETQDPTILWSYPPSPTPHFLRLYLLLALDPQGGSGFLLRPLNQKQKTSTVQTMRREGLLPCHC